MTEQNKVPEVKQEKFKKPSKADITRQGVRDGLNDQQIVDNLNEIFGEGEGKLNCVRWYRYQDPQLTGRPRTTSVKKAEFQVAFKESLNGMSDEERASVVLELVEKNFENFISKISVDELKPYIPEALLPKTLEKEVKDVKEPKAKKAKKAKKDEAVNLGTEPEVPLTAVESEVAPIV